MSANLASLLEKVAQSFELEFDGRTNSIRGTLDWETDEAAPAEEPLELSVRVQHLLNTGDGLRPVVQCTVALDLPLDIDVRLRGMREAVDTKVSRRFGTLFSVTGGDEDLAAELLGEVATEFLTAYDRGWEPRLTSSSLELWIAPPCTQRELERAIELLVGLAGQLTTTAEALAAESTDAEDGEAAADKSDEG